MLKEEPKVNIPGWWLHVGPKDVPADEEEREDEEARAAAGSCQQLLRLRVVVVVLVAMATTDPVQLRLQSIY